MNTHARSIMLLAPEVIEKIAAGEVIERPASVLKELIENAIDAGSSHISIRIEDAGFGLISITDNGGGMSAADLKLCPVRYATSKIRTADDLFSVGTMGFRGEAMASICAVSNCTITSKPLNEEAASITINGGVPGQVVPAAHTMGTTVVVRDLFFNVPARKKFMKTARGEKMAIQAMVEAVAVAFPAIHFVLGFDGKVELDAPIVADVRSRIADIAGFLFAKELIQCEYSGETMSVLAYVSRPDHATVRPRFQNLYVNLRRVDNDTVTAAVREAFAKFLGFRFRPAFFCFLDIDPMHVDVNVHPTKKLIKFDDDRLIFKSVYTAVRMGLEEGLEIRQDLSLQEQIPQGDTSTLPADTKPSVSNQPYPVSVLSHEVSVFEPPNLVTLQQADLSQTVLSFQKQHGHDHKPLAPFQGSTVQLQEGIADTVFGLISCYQIHAMYILAPIKNGILLIDQHAAHERILYEQALLFTKAGRAESQQLLFPIVMELSNAECAIIDASVDYFRLFGFEVQRFSGTSVAISAIPAFMRDSSVQEALREMLEFLLNEDDPVRMSEPEKRFSAAFACGAAIKSGQKLDQEEMNALLNSLFKTTNPYTCPHGRPTIVRMSLDEIGRRFMR